MKLIEGYLSAFVQLQVLQPPLTFYSTSAWFALQIAQLHKKKVPDKEERRKIDKLIKKINYVVDNTHQNLKLSLYATEVKVATTDFSEWEETTDMVDNEGIPLTDTTVFRMFLYLRQSVKDIFTAVTEIGETYSVEIPSSGFLVPSATQMPYMKD